MMAVLSAFVLYESDWAFEKKFKLDIKFASYRPIPVSLYPINPQTVADHSIFETTTMPIVSIIVSWQRIMRIVESVLIEMRRNYRIGKTSPSTCQQENIHEPLGEFELPIEFEQMKAFETLNHVTFWLQ